MAESIEDTLKDADILLLLVAHSQFKQLSPDYVAEKTISRILD